VTALYGEITKTVVNRRVQWNIPCDPNNTAIVSPAFPRLEGEGLLCYIMRVFEAFISGGTEVFSPFLNWTFTGNGSTTIYSLPDATALLPAAYLVYIDGVVQAPVNYTIASGNPLTIVFSTAIPNGSQVVIVCMGSASQGTLDGVTINGATINTATINNLTATGALALPVGSITSPMILNGTIINEDINAAAAIATSKLAPVLATGSTTARTLENRFAEVVNVLDFGADPTGLIDSAPAIRSAIASNRTILIPSGTYLLNSTVTAPPSAYDPPCVLFNNVNNFSVVAYGATFQIGNAAARCGAFQFNRCDNFSFVGAKFIGNISANVKNSAVATSSITNFRIADLYIVNMYRGGDGTGCVGTWAVNGSFDNITLKNVNIGFDHGLFYNVSYSNIMLFGCDTNGSTGTGQVGQKGFSLINDPPNTANNFTGYSFNRSKGITYSNCYVENFATGALLTSGYGIAYSNCRFAYNTGGNSARGIGIYINYDTGTFSSVGVAAGNVAIDGCEFIENGTSVVGAGIYIDASQIVNSDYIQNISITGCIFDNNTSQGIALQTPFTRVRNITCSGNVFFGVNQTNSISPDLLTIINSTASDNSSFATDVSFRDQIRLENNKAIFFKASDNITSLPVFGLSNTNVAYVRPTSAAALIQLQNFAGATVLQTTGAATLAIGSTGMSLLYNNGTTTSLQQVTVGAAGSGGTGFRQLIVPN
jgi:hypothetical protein